MSMAKLKQSFHRLRTSSSTNVSTEIKLLDVGDEAPDFELKDEDGNVHKLSSFRGRRVILSFYRYASCPLCLYNIDRLKQQAALLQKAEIVTLCIFRSTPAMMKRAAVVDGTSEDTHTLSDRRGSIYNKFQVKPNFKTVPTALMKLRKNEEYEAHFNPGTIIKEINGGLTPDGARALCQLPADFLIDENGIIVDLLRATKPQDFMEFERIEAFIPKNKRCKCNKKDCISPTCRNNYEQIRMDSESMLFVG